MELLIVIYACKTNSARKIIAVIPYLPYSRQCKMRKRGCITAKLVAKLLCNAGYYRMLNISYSGSDRVVHSSLISCKTKNFCKLFLRLLCSQYNNVM